MWHTRRSVAVKAGCCVWKSSSCQVCDSTYIITYRVHTHNANTRLCVHNNVMSYSKSSLWPPKGVKPFLNLKPGQEVGPYLFPFPVLFLLRDLCFEIVHPDNGAVVGIVHCISFFSRLCCTCDDLPHQTRAPVLELQPGEGKARDCWAHPGWDFFFSFACMRCLIEAAEPNRCCFTIKMRQFLKRRGQRMIFELRNHFLAFLASPIYMLRRSLISWEVHLHVAAFCVQLLNCGCGALQTGRRLHCSHGRDSTVSSPSTQDVGLDLCNSKKKKKGTTFTAHAHYPQSTTENNRAPPHIPLLSQEPHWSVPTVVSRSETVGHC